MDLTYIFNRIEKKYLLSKQQYDALLSIIDDRMVPDRFSNSTVCSLYLDTPDHLIIRNSIDAQNYKEKLRLRSYGTAYLSSTVFLELKKKINGIVYKRRVSMTLDEANKYLNNGIKPSNSQIMSEIDYAMHFYHCPKPTVFIACEREAWASLDHSDLRITFDRSVRFRTTNLRLDTGSGGKIMIPDQSVLMEIKTGGAMPLWLSASLGKIEIYPTSFSKYGTAYLNTIKQDMFYQQKQIITNNKGEYQYVSNF